MLVPIELQPLPLSEDALEEYRIKTLRQPQPGLVGGHITRRMGDSLEFQEHTYYNPGDDIRHVDWRASTRPNWRGSLRPSDSWLVRRFAAEEQLRILISVDTRETLGWPTAMPKIQIAAWLMEALSFVALRSDYQIVQHRLFGTSPVWSRRLRGRAGLKQYASSLRGIVAELDASERLSTEGLERYLPPAAVWIIVSDFYFDAAAARQLAQHINAAQEGMRWIILVELDSWPHERALLQSSRRARRIKGPAVRQPKELRVDDKLLKVVDSKIAAHRAAFLDQLKSVSLEKSPWRWSEEKEIRPARFFKDQFENDKELERLFMRKQW